MNIGVVSLFPEMIYLIAKYGIIGRASEKEIVSLRTFNPRNFTEDSYQKVDDKPYGGGPGMVMKYKPLKCAINSAKNNFSDDAPVILLSPHGKRFDQKTAKRFSLLPELILVAGRYEGIDQRLIDHHIDEEISLGDFILSGGEMAAMSMIDAIVRLIPGSLGDDTSSLEESFEDNLLEYPQYTRPEEIDGLKCPDVLLSGDHAAIKVWRKEQAVLKTYKKRPDLLGEMTEDQKIIVNKHNKLIND
ncbi:MAG: tRNA (guanosine(37)-N1)-methyltransferase TrmD [Pseudomonadota bacterium]|nr:tRNA (guanosine(37)-N1)-methyltransferase TrmD [Pseudomonadota bacterium]